MSAALFASAALAESHGDGASIALPDDAEAAAAGAEPIFKRSCRACHGNNAQGAASYPGLADLEADYVAEKLVAYRAGERFGPNSIVMIQHAKPLSDEDIGNLAVYVTTAFD